MTVPHPPAYEKITPGTRVRDVVNSLWPRRGHISVAAGELIAGRFSRYALDAIERAIEAQFADDPNSVGPRWRDIEYRLGPHRRSTGPGLPEVALRDPDDQANGERKQLLLWLRIAVERGRGAAFAWVAELLMHDAQFPQEVSAGTIREWTSLAVDWERHALSQLRKRGAGVRGPGSPEENYQQVLHVQELFERWAKAEDNAGMPMPVRAEFVVYGDRLIRLHQRARALRTFGGATEDQRRAWRELIESDLRTVGLLTGQVEAESLGGVSLF
jgi:hypothetical protein